MRRFLTILAVCAFSMFLLHQYHLMAMDVREAHDRGISYSR